MRSKCKKLVTDITRKADLDTNISEYADILSNQYNYYATVKMCMNYYTMKEMIEELEDDKSDLVREYNIISNLIKTHILDGEVVSEEALKEIRNLRDTIEYKMKNLTAYTDGYEIYEYILNRIEAGVMGNTEEVDIDELSAKMFQYVFSENDTVVINSKLQLLMSQLPVRMTKNKFYDIVSNTLSIYKGGEVSSVNDFADMLRGAALITKPDGFETAYPALYEVYSELEKADYKNMDKDTFNNLNDKLIAAAHTITEEVSVYMLMQEIVNDVYTILLTIGNISDDTASGKAYKSAVEILKACMTNPNMDEISEDIMDLFFNIEGIQETVYENIIILDSAFDDITKGNADVIEKLSLNDRFDLLKLANKLMSTSLFIDIDKDFNEESQIADNDYIMSLRDSITEEFAKLFDGRDRKVVRSIMSKILSAMPIFLNSQQEIKEYFDYVLGNCKDDSELTACNKLVCELIE